MTDPTSKNIRKFADIILIILFLLGISLPLAGSFLKLDPTPPIRENRQLATLPALILGSTSFSDYIEQFEAFYNDHFGFRQALIQGRSIILVKLLGVSSNPTVVLGPEGWFFLGDSQMVDYYQAKTLFSSEELATGQQFLENNRDILAQYGIHYLIVIAPNKNTIYPEQMPPQITRFNQVQRADQLLTYLDKHSELDIIYPKEALRQAKTQGLLYYPTDTHWNDRGAFVAYQEIVKPLNNWFPDLQPLPASKFEIITTQQFTSDLIVKLGLENVLQEQATRLAARQPMPAHKADPHVGTIPAGLMESRLPSAMEIEDETLPRAVVFHDSFVAYHLKTFLSQHFSRTAFFHTAYYSRYEDVSSIIEREQPDVVIYEFVERKLQQPGIDILQLDQAPSILTIAD